MQPSFFSSVNAHFLATLLLSTLLQGAAQKGRSTRKYWPVAEKIAQAIQELPPETDFQASVDTDSYHTVLYHLIDRSAYHAIIDLLPAACDMNLECGEGCVPLQVALRPRSASRSFLPQEEVALVEKLLKKGAHPNPSQGVLALPPPLYLALDPQKKLPLAERLAIVRALVHAGADRYAPGPGGKHALHYLLEHAHQLSPLLCLGASQEDFEAFKALLELLTPEQDDLCGPPGQEATPLQCLIKQEALAPPLQLALVAYLLAGGAPPDATTPAAPHTPLRLLVVRLPKEPDRIAPLIACLLAHGANPSQPITPQAESLLAYLLPETKQALSSVLPPWPFRLLLLGELLAPRAPRAPGPAPLKGKILPPLSFLHRVLAYPSAACPPAIRMALLQLLLEAWARQERLHQINQLDDQGYTPLQRVLTQPTLLNQERAQLARLLLLHGANPNTFDPTRLEGPAPPLHLLLEGRQAYPHRVRQELLALLLGADDSQGEVTRLSGRHRQALLAHLESRSPEERRAWQPLLAPEPPTPQKRAPSTPYPLKPSGSARRSSAVQLLGLPVLTAMLFLLAYWEEASVLDGLEGESPSEQAIEQDHHQEELPLACPPPGCVAPSPKAYLPSSAGQKRTRCGGAC